MTSALPAQPDLEHLRRQAKRLHRALLASDTDAIGRLTISAPGLEPTLSTAQLIIAREYGFDSWGQLRQLVTSIASSGVRYDTIGHGYAHYRRADPRIAAVIHTALGDARTVVNLGAGTGSYEPTDRPVVPIEPSTAMAMQRDPALPPAVRAVAESLPLADDSADAVMGVLTLHHWTDYRRGLAEAARVARRRVVLLTVDPEIEADMWLFADYFPGILEIDRACFPSPAEVTQAMGGDGRVTPVPVPADCADGFLLAFWSRPQAVLDPGARAATSGFARLSDEDESAGVARLTEDLASGAWDASYGHLRTESSLDVGLRLITVEL